MRRGVRSVQERQESVMASNQSTQKPALWLLPFAGVGMLVFLSGQLVGRVQGTEYSTDPYDRLYDVIMARKDSEGNAYSKNEVGPLIYARSKFPFDDETYPKLTKALVGFDALPEEKIESYGTVKRALLQRHLWVVFDATIPHDYKPPTAEKIVPIPNITQSTGKEGLMAIPQLGAPTPISDFRL